MDAFKVPQSIPQDLLLIQGIIGTPNSSRSLANFHQLPNVAADDDIESSDGETASEDEIEATLTAVVSEEEVSESDPDSSSSTESDSESSSEKPSLNESNEKRYAIPETDDEEAGEPSHETRFQTQNEVVEVGIVIPDITEVGQDEVLEKVGEIITVTGNTAVINGLPSEVVGRGSERALDSETLLVFNDRKVMGCIYETFGPTSQPLYQVKFNKDFPLDAAQVKISREVFHVPARSNFVFTRGLQAKKGSDASNMHDEEPGENELEFSDDEAEAAHKAALKKKRQSGFQSVTSSRQTTPAPSQMHDQDMMALSRNPYDERGLYDDEYDAGPSRPPPIPYDDPYSESYTVPDPIPNQRDYLQSNRMRPRSSPRGRGRRDPGRRGRRGGLFQSHVSQKRSTIIPSDGFSLSEPGYPRNAQYTPRPMSPISLAAGQLSNVFDSSSPQNPSVSTLPATDWGYSDSYHHQPPIYHFGTAGYPQAFIQPHINPRFATAMGIDINMTSYYNQSSPPYSPQNGLYPPRPTSTNQNEQWTTQTGPGATTSDFDSRSPSM